MLECIRHYIPWDSAWWAMSTEREDGQHLVHSSYAIGMPDDIAERVSRVLPHNLIARETQRSPGICMNFGPEQLLSDLPQAMVMHHIGDTYALCTAWQGNIPQLFTFLSLGRNSKAVPFTEDERRLKQVLMPHLMDMAQVNRITEISSIRLINPQSRSALAVTDELGLLHAAESRLESLIRIEWPDWQAPFLPKPLLAAISARQECYLGTRLLVRFRRVGVSILVTVAQRPTCDALSPRERAVAQAFASGDSYKEVARCLELSPATVRHHLRNVYEKLGVADKGRLSKLLSEEPPSDQNF